jgi:hypothetical protein
MEAFCSFRFAGSGAIARLNENDALEIDNKSVFKES